MVKFSAIIPVRCGSKSIKMKNIKPFLGRPLVYWLLDAASESLAIDQVIVSTDCKEIARVIEEYPNDKIEVLKRSKENASDTASTESVIEEVLPKVKNENIILLQATSPLTKTEHIDAAIEKFINMPKTDVISVVREHRFYWKEQEQLVQPLNYDVSARPRRQDFSGTLVENGAIYITTKEKFNKSGSRLSENITFIEMPKHTLYEIDDEEDWRILESIGKEMKKNTLAKKEIKLFATDCDGVLTDAGMYYSSDGDVMKKFNTKDGMAVQLLREKGIRVAILTGENSEIVLRRAEKLNIEDVFLGCKNKVDKMEQLLKKYDLTYDNIAYIGDDLNDLDLLKKVGLSFSVMDAVPEIKNQVDYVTTLSGGEGAFREAADIILKRENQYE